MGFGVIAKRKKYLTWFFEYEEKAIKMSARSVFKTERDCRQLLPLMKEDATAVSKSLFLFQRHLELEMYEHVHENHDDIDYFAKFHETNHFRKAFVAFKDAQLVGDNIEFPDLAGRAELYRHQVDKFAVAFKENMSENMRAHIRMHYEFLIDRPMDTQSARRHVNRLFSGEEIDRIWEVRVGRKVLNLEQMRTKEKMYLLLPALIRINQQIRIEQMRWENTEAGIPPGLKTFSVVPQKKWGTQYIDYDDVAMRGLLNRRAKIVNDRNKALNNGKKKLKIFSKKCDTRKMFASAFKIKDFERNDEKGIKTRFGEHIFTNGYTASVMVDRRIDKNEVSQQKN